MMKLGILVVYIVAEDEERLLDIHLSQIHKNTNVPYVIYAAVNRLLPRIRQTLERLPYVKICAIPDTDHRSTSEHAYYLDRLAAAAVEDGATHICVFHLDSFPINPSWVERVVAQLHGDYVLAGIRRDSQNERKPVTDFLMFKRDFYLTHRPTFVLTESVRTSAEYGRYLKAHPHTWESGVGYGFKIWSEGLSWFPLDRTDRGKDRYYSGGVYGDLIFHLGGAVRRRGADMYPAAGRVRVARALSLLRVAARAMVPPRFRRHLQILLGPWLHAHSATPLFQAGRRALLDEPDQFHSSFGMTADVCSNPRLLA